MAKTVTIGELQEQQRRNIEAAEEESALLGDVLADAEANGHRPTTDGQNDEETVKYQELMAINGEVVDENETTQSDDPDIYPVPTDRSFGAFDTRRASDLHEIMCELISTVPDFDWLADKTARILVYWDRKGGSSDGHPVLTTTKRANKREARELGATIVLTFAADHCRDMRVKRAQMEALLGERLYSIGKDESGRIRRVGPDTKVYFRAFRRWGPYLAELAKLRELAQIAPSDPRNASLFEAYEGDE